MKRLLTSSPAWRSARQLSAFRVFFNHFNHRGAGALGHGAFGRRGDHLVVGGDEVPAF
jgi:hypothetical protein